MPLIEQFINLAITLDSRAPTQAGFGTPLLVGHHTAWPVALIKSYSAADDMLTDGFDSSSQLYQDALVLCAQNPRPPIFKVGRRQTPLTQTIEIVPTITAQGFQYTGTIDGKAFAVTNGAGATIASVCTALAAAFTALSTGVTPTATATKVSIASTVAGKVHAMWFDDGVDITDVTADTTTDTELAAINAKDSAWYGLIVSDTQSKASGLLQASWIEAQKKLAIFQTADSAVGDPGATTDVMSALKAASYKNIAPIYHRRIGGSERLNTGWMSGQLVPDPGYATPAFKTVAGVSVDSLSTTFANAVLAKNGSVYVTEGGLNITFEGKTPSGQFLDTTRGLHWLYARIQEAILFLFANAQIVPFTDDGVEMVKNAIRGVLSLAVQNGFLSPDVTPVVTAPRARSVAAADRANRRLPNISFTAALGGAIHGVTIRGTVSV